VGSGLFPIRKRKYGLRISKESAYLMTGEEEDKDVACHIYKRDAVK
jgi:hypothetical protein